MPPPHHHPIPIWSVDISFKDDVSIILGISFMNGCFTNFERKAISTTGLNYNYHRLTRENKTPTHQRNSVTIGLPPNTSRNSTNCFVHSAQRTFWSRAKKMCPHHPHCSITINYAAAENNTQKKAGIFFYPFRQERLKRSFSTPIYFKYL